MTRHEIIIGLAGVLVVATTGWAQVSIDARQQTIRRSYNQSSWVTTSTTPAIGRSAAAPAPVYSRRPAGQADQQTRLNQIIPLRLDGVTAKSAIEYIAELAGLNLVVNWDALRLIGADPDAPVRLNFRAIPVSKALDAVCMQMTDQSLYLDVDPWVTRLLTRDQANSEVITRIYPVGDLLYEAPDFDTAPKFDLNSIVSDNTGGGSSLYSNTSTEKVVTKTNQEKGEELAQMIRQTIEPDIWLTNGGNVASVRYFNGMLIVRAPKYVHRRLGFSNGPANRPAASAPPVYRTYGAAVSGSSQTTSRRVDVRVGYPPSRRSPGVWRNHISGVDRYVTRPSGVGR